MFEVDPVPQASARDAKLATALAALGDGGVDPDARGAWDETSHGIFESHFQLRGAAAEQTRARRP